MADLISRRLPNPVFCSLRNRAFTYDSTKSLLSGLIITHSFKLSTAFS